MLNFFFFFSLKKKEVSYPKKVIIKQIHYGTTYKELKLFLFSFFLLGHWQVSLYFEVDWVSKVSAFRFDGVYIQMWKRLIIYAPHLVNGEDKNVEYEAMAEIFCFHFF